MDGVVICGFPELNADRRFARNARHHTGTVNRQQGTILGTETQQERETALKVRGVRNPEGRSDWVIARILSSQLPLDFGTL